MVRTKDFSTLYHVRWYRLCKPKGEYLQEI